jgi:hypothetical protein
MREVNHEDDEWRQSYNWRREDLELHVLVQERPLPDQSCRTRGRAGRKNIHGRRLYSETLVREDLCIADPVAVLEGTQVFHKKGSFFAT